VWRRLWNVQKMEYQYENLNLFPAHSTFAENLVEKLFSELK